MPRRLAVIADKAALRRIVRRLPPSVGAGVTGLGKTARGGTLWVVAAGVLSLFGPPGRRAAAGGLLAGGTASAIANGPAKWFVHRDRPGGAGLADLPRRDRAPTTSSFPSSHTASAFAFAIAASAQCPPAAPLLVPAALGVGLARLYAVRHYPTDVLAGAALGTAIGTSTAYSIHRWRTTKPRAVTACEEQPTET